MIPLTIDAIKNYLKSKAIEATLQKETNQLCISLKITDREFPFFIRIFQGDQLLQLLAFLPCNTKENTIADTARLLHLLNKEIDLPGFGMDETAHVVFYRCMIAIKDKQIDPVAFDAFFNAVQVVCQTFTSVVAAVAYGAVTFADVLKQSKAGTSQPLIKKAN